MAITYWDDKQSALTKEEMDENFRFLEDGKQDALTYDSTPTNGSMNPVTSDGIFDAIAAVISDTAYDATSWNGVTGIAPSKNAVRDVLETKQDTLTFDLTPTIGSANPVTSGGVYNAINSIVSDTAYNATTWNGVVGVAPSKNAVRDVIETKLSLSGGTMTGNLVFSDLIGLQWGSGSFINDNAGGIDINGNSAVDIIAPAVAITGQFSTSDFIVAGTYIAPNSYTVAGVPNASLVPPGSMIYISNEAGGAVPAFSDGTNWRRVTDRAIIS